MQLWRQATLEAIFTGVWVWAGLLIGASGSAMWGKELPGRMTLVNAFLNMLMFSLYLQVAMIPMASKPHLEQQAILPELNPAVTLTQVLKGVSGPAGGLLYITAQCGGAIAAAFCVKEVLTQEQIDSFLLGGCYAKRSIAVSSGEASMTVGFSAVRHFFTELALSFTFLYVAELLTRPVQLRALGLKHAVFLVCANIGLDVYLSRAMGMEYSGSNFNPARCLGPAVAYGQPLWDRLWPSVVAPLVAAFPVALILAVAPADYDEAHAKKQKDFISQVRRRWRLCSGTGDCPSAQVDDSELDIDIRVVQDELKVQASVGSETVSELHGGTNDLVTTI